MVTGAGGVPAWDTHPDVARWAGRPRLQADASADVCVVGLGASGLAAMEAAVERGLSVIGIDAGRVAAGAAGRNAGFLLGGTALSPHEMVDFWGPERAATTYRETLAEIDRVEANLGPEVVRRTGSVRLAGLPGSPDEAEWADCLAHAAALRSMGVAVETCEGPLGRGLLMPDDAAVNPALRCVLTAARLAVRAGVSLHEGTPALAIEPGRVRTPGGDVTTGAVVVCVDGGLERLIPQLASRVRTARLNVLATEPVIPRLPWPVYARWGWDYAQQASDGALIVGGGRDLADGDWVDQSDGPEGGGGSRAAGGERRGIVVHPTGLVQRYLDGLAAEFAGGPVKVTHRWIGLAAFTDDRQPVCEVVDDGVAAAGAYSGVGNLVGPITARRALSLLL